MMASVSSAAGESRRGRSANCARSIASAYSRCVRNCHPCAISISSTPWSPVAKAFRSSTRAARTAAAPACGSRVTNSSTVSGRAEANSAASTSFARGLTADLLVLRYPAHQLGARILPLVVAHVPGQEHLRLDPQQPGRHLEVVRRLVQPQLVNDREELVGDLRDRQVGDVDLVLTDQVQQQIQGARELLELDDEAGLVLSRGRKGGHEATPIRSPPTTARPRLISWSAGHRKTLMTPGASQRIRRSGSMPSA